MRRMKLLLACVAFTASSGAATLCSAQQPDTADDPIDLGPVQGFPDEDTALASCKPDGVVWADRRTGFYYPKCPSGNSLKD